MLKTIQFIRHNANWRELLSGSPYSIGIKDDEGFTILKYSQIDSDFNIEIVRECRGLIIDENSVPVCVPFFKFGNYGEPYADEIDWNTAQVEEKIDGSLLKVWHYGGKWIVSTNGTIFANKARIGSEDVIRTDSSFNTYGDLFKEACKGAGLDLEHLNPQYTYMFEIVSPHNRVVVPYESIDIYHIGARDNVTLQEIDIDIGVKKPKCFQCNNISDLIEMASKLRYCEEGFVVKDAAFHRIKVKSPAYVAVSHLINGMSEKRLLELIRTNETSEFLSYFPEFKVDVSALQLKISDLMHYLDTVIKEKIKPIEYCTRKEYADMAMKTKYPAFCFQLLDGKVHSPQEWVWSMPNDKVLEMLSKL